MQAQTYLAIGAHPDDLDFSCGGTLAKLSRGGARVVIAMITDGSKGSYTIGKEGEELVRIREEEQRKAAAVLGIPEVRFLGETDGELENSLGLRRKLVRLIRQIRPDVILSFDPADIRFASVYRSHRDHRIAGEAVFDAVYPAARNKSYFPELLKEGLEPHIVRAFWFYASADPTMSVDISEDMTAKIEAIQSHASQVRDPAVLADMVKERAREAGFTEAFRVLNITPHPQARPSRV